MRTLIPRWYSPFRNGWKLCSYQTKGVGYDKLSHRLHDFKERNQTAIDAFTAWSLETLDEVLPDLKIDYCIRSLGRAELKPSQNKPLHQLAESISEQFEIEFIPELIAKKRVTRHLVELKTKAEREAELEGVFYLNKEINLSGSSILLVDDIRTSGTTSTFIRRTILERFPDVCCYLFVLAQTNDNGGNSQETIDRYSNYC